MRQTVGMEASLTADKGCQDWSPLIAVQDFMAQWTMNGGAMELLSLWIIVHHVPVTICF
jgi:hypothetical protein